MSQLLTIDDVAKKLKVSKRTIQRWQDKGTIAYIKLPQGVRFREEVLENWLEKKTIKQINKIA
jgi:excisionase family DNA binding protein